MKKHIVFALILAGAVFFTSCKKKKDDEATPTPAAKSKTELLTAHKWVGTNITANKAVNYDGDVSTSPSADIWGQTAACDKDNFLSLFISGTTKTGVLNEGPTMCGTVQENAFTWSLNTAETELTLTGAAGSEVFTIVQLDENTLIISSAETDKDGLDYIETETLTTAPATDVSKFQTLTSQNWILTGATADQAVNYDGNTSTAASTNVYAQMDACEKDDFITFDTNGNGSFNDNTNTCSGTVASDPFTWFFNADETTMTINEGGSKIFDVAVVQLNANTLQVSYDTEDEDGLAYTLTQTYSKK